MASKIVLNKDLTELSESHLERILKVVNKTIDELYNEYLDGEVPEVCEDLLECKYLGEKLLYYDYFATSESYLDSLVGHATKYSSFMQTCDTWDKLQKKETKIKEQDLKKFLKLVIKNLSNLGEI